MNWKELLQNFLPYLFLLSLLNIQFHLSVLLNLVNHLLHIIFQIEFLNEPIQNSKLDEIVRGISSYIPARCVLTGLKQAVGALRHNKRITRNGQHYRGQIWLT